MGMNDGKDKTENKTAETDTTAGNGGSSPTPQGASSSDLPASIPVGGITSNFSGSMPSGLFSSTLGLDADVSKELQTIAPTFGDVLLSIGTGIADSQAALDKSLVDTAKELSKTKIKVVSEVIQKLNDDGLPDAEKTELITNEVSLINFISPTVHEWKYMSLSMDLIVGAMDQESGMSFTQTQSSAGFSVSWFPWAFGGWFQTDVQYQNSRQRTESDWASGQVRMDAMLGPRRTTKFPVPAEVTIGPAIYFSQGALKEKLQDEVVTERSMDIMVKVLKASGAPNPAAPLEVDVDRFALSFVDDDDFNGSMTNPDGEIKISVRRDIPNPNFAAPVKATVTVRLGQIVKTLTITI